MYLLMQCQNLTAAHEYMTICVKKSGFSFNLNIYCFVDVRIL